MQEAFVGRQPIFDADLKVYAYELLFRPGNQLLEASLNGEQATSQVLVNTFTEFGLDQIVGDHKAFINVTRDLLLSDEALPLPPQRVVLEVLETVAVDRTVIDAVRGLAEQGFSIALDDFVYRDDWLPLVQIADIIKIDVLSLSPGEVAEHVRLLRPHKVKLLAEKVETQEEFNDLHALGFEFFQGFFLARPTVMRRRRVPTNRLSTLRLLANLQRQDAEVTDIERLIREDVSLSFKILRYINSAFFALPREVSSIREAIVYMGLRDIRRWASLVALSGFDDQPSELLQMALVRARMGELLAGAVGHKDTSEYFTLGLLSSLDLLLNAPLDAVLAELPLSDELRDGLLERSGPLGEALACILAYERLDWPRVKFAGLPVETLCTAYLQAVEWSIETRKAL